MTWQELCEALDKGEIEDNGVYQYYPTEGHQKKDLPWWIWGAEAKRFIPAIKESNRKFLNALLWGNKTTK